MPRFAFLILLAACVPFSVVQGAPDIQPEAADVMRAVQTHVAGLDSLAVNASVTEESVFGDKHKLQFGGTLDLIVERPANLYAEIHQNNENRRLYLHNGEFTVFDEDVNVYVQAPAPGPVAEALQHLSATYGFEAPLSELVGGHAYDQLVTPANRVIYLGLANIDGVSCHHLAGTLTDIDWQLWVRSEGDPWPCRYVLTDRSIPLAPQYSVTFRNWQSDPDVETGQFRFQAPADSEAIEFVKAPGGGS